MAKHNLSSQDVRNKLIDLRDSLVQNLEFITECIDQDYKKLKAYYDKYGDLQYRPVLSRNTQGGVMLGEPTDLVIEPLAGKYRATINSLLQSIRLIESDILPEDNPEGSTAKSATPDGELTKKRATLRDQFKAQAAIEGEQPTPQEDALETKAVPMNPIIEPMPKAKPWRGEQKKFVAKVSNHPERPMHVEKEPKGETPPVQMTNPNPMDAESEKLRAGLMSLKGSSGGRMASMREKYGKGKK